MDITAVSKNEKLKMTNLSQIRWGRYRDYEGPTFGGVIKVPDVTRSSPFADRVLKITSAAEGNVDAINMYDSGLVSVGAIQFTDNGSFQVTDMLGAVAEELGLEYVLNTLQPALSLSGSTFVKTSSNVWRFSLNGTIVNTKELQKRLYFKDSSGNRLGSYNENKRLYAKTWAMCLANIWQDPRAIDVQVRFTLPRLINNFVWNELKKDLFTGVQPEDGWMGATRALLLSFAVNSPATVVKRYALARNNKHKFGSPEWCLTVLRTVVTAGIDVWPARWGAKLPLIKSLFGVTLPKYNELLNNPNILPQPSDNLLIEPIVTIEDNMKHIREIQEVELTDTSREVINMPVVEPIVNVSKPSGVFAIIVHLVKMMLEVLARVFKR